MASQNDIRLGRLISLVLRHDPSAAGITLDEHGWAVVDDLLSGMNRRGHSIDPATLRRIVAENDKARYCLSQDGRRIRANQGHSVDVDVQLAVADPPAELFHGTAERFLDSIKRAGLQPRQRQYIHLSADVDTAIKVGRRHGAPVVLRVDSAAMAHDGHIFRLSQNNVWLTDAVPWRYLTPLPR
ncbi:MAG: RNA 2'-phosphotransferase [Propionibacteriaceae bacterium]|jgi:putative RNA 2'-phosphotransferase|nr:RNA 2'-phosphotransferase [Propionibacteriaceae bacterium]